MRNLPNAQDICAADDGEPQQHQQTSEPPRFPPGRSYFDRDLDARLTPWAPTGRALNLKTVLTRRQRGVTGKPLIAADFVPCFFQLGESVTIAVRRRAAKTQRGKLDRKTVLVM